MIKCLIVDDEPLAQQVIANHVRKVPSLQIAGICSNAIEAFEFIHREKIDLLFLDIKMPAINGMDFIKSLSNAPAVIFTTAYPEYAVSSYEVGAIDYLLKPITFERFESSVQKYMSLHQAAQTKQHTNQPNAYTAADFASPKVDNTNGEVEPPQPNKNYAFFKVNGKFMKLEHSQIHYAQSIKDYIMLYTETGNHMTHMTMKYLEELLPANQFIRIHRSYLVNKEKITAIDKKEIQIAGETLPIGKSYKEEIIQLSQF